jgi:hypothetical protein
MDVPGNPRARHGTRVRDLEEQCPVHIRLRNTHGSHRGAVLLRSIGHRPTVSCTSLDIHVPRCRIGTWLVGSTLSGLVVGARARRHPLGQG